MNRRAFSVALAGLLALVFLLAIRQLYVLRFQAGDVFPPYSSLRADPLGTKALFDALDRLPGLTVERAYRDPTADGLPQTILLLGVSPEAEIAPEELAAVKTLAAGGARIVVAYLPEARKRKKKKEPKESALDAELGCRLVEIENPDKLPPAAEAVGERIEAELPWNSGLGFQAGQEWKPLLRRAGTPVAIERGYGRGSLVLLTDAYVFSNEALRKDRRPRLLAYLLGNSGRVIFDETRHGLHEQPGVAGLMRRYHLEPFLVLTAVLAGLFAWQNLAPLVPVERAQGVESPDEITGRDAMSGRTSLLRRSVPPRDLAGQCIRLWQASAGRREKTPLPRPPGKDPVAAYQAITRHLRKRKF